MKRSWTTISNSWQVTTLSWLPRPWRKGRFLRHKLRSRLMAKPTTSRRCRFTMAAMRPSQSQPTSKPVPRHGTLITVRTTTKTIGIIVVRYPAFNTRSQWRQRTASVRVTHGSSQIQSGEFSTKLTSKRTLTQPTSISTPKHGKRVYGRMVLMRLARQRGILQQQDG